MVVDAKWDTTTNKLIGHMQVITQLSGDPEVRDKVHEAIKPLSSCDGWASTDMIK